MNALVAFLTFIARLCLAAIFVIGGATKFVFYEDTVKLMTAHGFTAVPFFLVSAAIVEWIGALCLIFGYKTRIGAAILLLFLIPTTLIFHNFWDLTGEAQILQFTMFFKNVAIFGGLLFVLCHGSGVFGCDSCFSCKPRKEDKITETELKT